MRVLLLTDADVFAGTERHIFELAVSLHEFGVEPRVGCPDPSPLATAARQRDVEVVPIAKRAFVDRRAIGTMVDQLSGGGIDIVHAHNGRTALQATLAVNVAGKGRCVLTQHFLQPSHVQRKGISRIGSGLAHAWMNGQIDHFIAISHAVEQAMIRRNQAPRQRITVVPNGIHPPDLNELPPPAEMRRQLKINDDIPLIVSIARLEAEKDIATLVAAMANVVVEIPTARCVIVGDGQLRHALEKQIDQAGLQSSVTLLGYRSDALAILNAADLFVLPSLAEPFGLAILEAMSLAKPVIATRAGGPVEIVEEGRTGLLVPPRQASAMGNAILELLRDPNKMTALGRAGLKRFLHRFTSAQMASGVAAVYRRVLSGVVA
jgi:glycosyltransferase involved in cell wall biosynthesis